MGLAASELMTLAGIAYGHPADIPRYLDEDASTHGNWEATWIAKAEDVPVNFAFLAIDRRSGAHVLAIRGTYPNPFSPAYWQDGDEDSPFGDMVDWPGAPGAKISGGTATALGNLRALTDGAGLSLPEAIAGLPPGATLTVTGHSLGGTLAPVIALWISEQAPDRVVCAASFAGMTPGNGAFAALFGPGTGLDGRVLRYFNTLDTVAYGWDKVFATHDFYEPAPKGGLVVSALLLATAARLALGGYGYTAVGEPMPLIGTVQASTIGCELVAYVFENLHQHLPDTYLSLLGAPPLPFLIGFGSVVVPRDRAGATPVGARLQTYYLP